MTPGSYDFETSSFYDLTVTVSDPGGLTDVQMVTVNIIDVNEAPVIQNLPDSVTIAEDVVGITPVHSVNTIDQDGDLITYTITSWPFSTPFEIDVAGKPYLYCNNYNFVVILFQLILFYLEHISHLFRKRVNSPDTQIIT